MTEDLENLSEDELRKLIEEDDGSEGLTSEDLQLLNEGLSDNINGTTEMTTELEEIMIIPEQEIIFHESAVEKPNGDYEYAKSIAIRLRKDGRNTEALEWMRYAKMIVTPMPTIQPKPSGKMPPREIVTGNVFINQIDKYNELEENIISALKKSKAIVKKSADILIREKSYLEHLKKIDEARKEPMPPPPPLFQWVTEKRLLPTQLLEVPEDTIQLCINYAQSLQAVLQQHSARSMSVAYTLGFPRENPLTGKTSSINYNDSSDIATFNFNTFIPIKLNRSLSAIIPKRKAEFTLILHKGFFPFTSQVDLGTIIVPLENLSLECEVSGDYPLTSAKETGGRRKTVGGTLNIALRITHPLSRDSEHKIVAEEQVLVIDTWPSLHSPAITVGDTSGVTGSSSETITSSFAEVTDEEKNDPFNVKFYVGNDVLEAEIEFTKSTIQAGSKTMSEEQREDYELRLKLLETNLLMLVRKIQDEKLSLPDYLKILRSRIEKDKKLALYLKSVNKKDQAIRVLRRFKYLESELESAAGLG